MYNMFKFRNLSINILVSLYKTLEVRAKHYPYISPYIAIMPFTGGGVGGIYDTRVIYIVHVFVTTASWSLIVNNVSKSVHNGQKHVEMQ